MIGNILKTLRERHDYNQDYVADKVNINRSTYANYERESREPNIAMLIKLADLYEISVDYLLGHTPDKDMPEDIKELVDKYNRLSDEGRLRINNQIDCELRVDALAAEKRHEKQRQGIEASRLAGKQYGRPKAAITADWDDTYNQWKSGDITADDAARKLGISKATLYRRVRDEQIYSANMNFTILVQAFSVALAISSFVQKGLFFVLYLLTNALAIGYLLFI